MNSATMSGIGGLSMQQPPQLQHAPQTIKPPMPPMLNSSMQLQNQQHPSPHQHMPCQCRVNNTGMPCQCRTNAGMPCQQQQQQPMVYMSGQHHLNIMPPQNQFLSAARNSSAVSFVMGTYWRLLPSIAYAILRCYQWIISALFIVITYCPSRKRQRVQISC